jgi:hypothetical protein
MSKPVASLLLAASALTAGSFEENRPFLKHYCQTCHSGNAPAAGLNIDELSGPSDAWSRIAARVRNSEMPPRGAPAPAPAERESFVQSIDAALHTEACAAGVRPSLSPIRRLNRDEYSATMRDLLNLHVNAGHDLPADAAGGQGFDNAAEVLVLSPVLAEKYRDAARQALEMAVRNPQARKRIGIEEPKPGQTPEEAARAVLHGFIPKAFRRPVADAEAEPFMLLFRDALHRRQTYDASVVYMLRAVLMSPRFLFIAIPPNPGSQPRLLDDYALASRLSYFLQGSMPDDKLFDAAASGSLHDPETLKKEVARLLAGPKSIDFIDRFTSQWLGTRELGHEFVPDALVFPNYASSLELQGDIRLQPTVFLQNMLAANDPLTDLIDSNWTMLTKTLGNFYRIDPNLLPKEKVEQPHRIVLPPDSHRGGLLGMSAVLTVSSYPYRTSPVLRGKFVLDALLGTPPPPPPPNVPALEQHPAGQPETMRERLARHRADPVCGGCHSRIDPLGFALENFDAIGQWRNEDAGKPLDITAELPDGTKFEGPDRLKSVLMDRKDLFIRNLTARMLGYALGRGLTPADSCAVDDIVNRLKDNGYKSRTWIEAIVMSPVFRFQAGGAQ